VTTVRLIRPGQYAGVATSVWELLQAVDGEFVPPLSGRDSTTTKSLQGQRSVSGPTAYFEALLQQHALLALDGDRVVALMSFRVGEREAQLGECVPATYISTVAVLPEARRRGLARRLYAEVMRLPSELASPCLGTRTWSTNDTHLPLLEALGFHEVTRLTDHRGPGVDTVYFARALD